MPDADHYEAFGSTSDDHVHLIVRAGAFDVLPRLVRDQGSWQLVRRGEMHGSSPQLSMSWRNTVIISIVCLLPSSNPRNTCLARGKGRPLHAFRPLSVVSNENWC